QSRTLQVLAGILRPAVPDLPAFQPGAELRIQLTGHHTNLRTRLQQQPGLAFSNRSGARQNHWLATQIDKNRKEIHALLRQTTGLDIEPIIVSPKLRKKYAFLSPL